MSNSEKKQQTPQEQYASARGAWLFFVIATAINLVLGMAKSGWQFPFMSELVNLVGGLFDGIAASLIGLCITAVFAVIWRMTEKRRGMMTIATLIYLADSILAVIKIVTGQMDTMILLCAVVRLLLLWAMLMGVKAAKLLKKAEEEPMVILNEEKSE